MKTHADNVVALPATPAADSHSNAYTTRDGRAVAVHRRARSGSTRKDVNRTRRADPKLFGTVHAKSWKVAAPLRHSHVGARDQGLDGHLRFMAPTVDLGKVEDLCAARGVLPEHMEAAAFLNYTGGELERLEEYLLRMELPLDDPELLDAMVFPDWERFSRADEVEVATILARVRKAGGDLWFASNTSLDIYDDEQAPLVAVTNALASLTRKRQKRKAAEGVKELAKQGRVPHAAWCCTRVREPFIQTLADGSTRIVPVGALLDVEAAQPFGREVYLRLDRGDAPAHIAKWLNDNADGEHPECAHPGKRVRTEDGTVVEMPGAPWTGGLVVEWASKHQNMGFIKLGGHVHPSPYHKGCIDELTWGRVNAGRGESEGGSRTGSTKEPSLGSGIVRCQFCRSSIGFTSGATRSKRYQCTSTHCKARAGATFADVEAIIERALRASIEQDRMEAEPVAADHEAERALLAAAKTKAATSAAKANADLDLYESNPEQYNALTQEAGRREMVATKALADFDARTRVAHTKREAVEDYDGLSLAKRRALVRATWPIIWLRLEEHVTADGEVKVAQSLAERLWFVPAGDDADILLPRKGFGYNPNAHQPIEWWDGSTTRTADERKADRKPRAGVAGVVAKSVKGRTDADEARWRDAREHFLAHGRTNDEVMSAIEAANGNRCAAARELGMHQSSVAERVRKELVARGELDDGTSAERLRRRRYDPALVTDEEVIGWVQEHDGNYTKAARELGMPVRTLMDRYERCSGDAELLARAEAKAQQRREALRNADEATRKRQREATERYRARKRAEMGDAEWKAKVTADARRRAAAKRAA